MCPDDLFSVADNNKPPAKKAAVKKDVPAPPKMGSNVPQLSVSDLAFSLKRTLEETYGRIRVRGELSGLKLAASGHLYGDIKDTDANINIICWKGTMSKMAIKPEEGMDVLITGKVSSYAKSSRYQIIIEKMELAGEGALLKMLEERKKKLAAEGLFDAERKKSLPFLPQTIGVITSPTGSVIQDILHRLRDRFPRRVMVWPAKVQGDGAAEQVAKAIDGFNAMEIDRRPDLLIVARGGGSLEDLMAFNEEIVVRAVANSGIPIITAVGHETDTTLVDYASDYRAPTPTGAAEVAVPVRMNLVAQVQDDFQRLLQSAKRIVNDRRNALDTQIAKLGSPDHLLEAKSQTVDYLGDRLANSLKSALIVKKGQLQDVSSKLVSPAQALEHQKQAVKYLNERLVKTLPAHLKAKNDNLIGISRVLDSLSPKSVLNRGYSLVYDENGQIVREISTLKDQQAIKIEFSGNQRVDAEIKKR